MPVYKLNYFDARGRAEIARLIFAYAGQDYEDNRMDREAWLVLKPNSPFGQMPFLEVDGKQIGQSVAIANYLAREFGLYGKTNMESCEIDQVVCLVQDYLSSAIKAYFEKDEAKKAELTKTHQEETIPKFLGLFENLLKKNVSDDYFVGSSLTLADLFVYDLLWNMVNNTPTALDNYKLLKAHRDRVGSVKQIKEYVEKRKVTTM